MTTDKSAPAGGSIMVVGGGISGLTTALEAAEVGYEVLLIEKEPSLGGRVSQLKQYFPKLCPPTCGLEINYKRIKDNPRIKVITMAEVEKVEGTPGDYTVEVRISPRYVNENCTACGECAKVCESEISNEFNFGMDRRKAAYLPHNMAFPTRYVMAPSMGADDREKVKKPANTTLLTLTCRRKAWISKWVPLSGPPVGSPMMRLALITLDWQISECHHQHDAGAFGI